MFSVFLLTFCELFLNHTTKFSTEPQSKRPFLKKTRSTFCLNKITGVRYFVFWTICCLTAAAQSYFNKSCRCTITYVLPCVEYKNTVPLTMTQPFCIDADFPYLIKEDFFFVLHQFAGWSSWCSTQTNFVSLKLCRLKYFTSASLFNDHRKQFDSYFVFSLFVWWIRTKIYKFCICIFCCCKVTFHLLLPAMLRRHSEEILEI